MLYFIFTFNFADLNLYTLLFRISTILVPPTLILNSDLIEVQRFLAYNNQLLSSSLRIYLPCSSSIFLENLLWFFLLSSGNFLNNLQWSKTVLIFISDYEIFLVLYIWEALLYFDHCENSKKMFSCLFVLAWICLIAYVPLHYWHRYQNRNHLMNSLLSSFELWESDS